MSSNVTVITELVIPKSGDDVNLDLYLFDYSFNASFFIRVDYPSSTSSNVSCTLFRGYGKPDPSFTPGSQPVAYVINSSTATFETTGTSQTMSMPIGNPAVGITSVLFQIPSLPDWNRFQLTNRDSGQDATVSVYGVMTLR